MKKSAAWTVLIYGLILIVLGYMGYRQGSLPSLIAGSGLGFLLAVSSIGMFAKKRVAGYAALFLTTALTVVFSYRYALTNKPLTAALAVLSGAMLIFLLLHLTKWRK
jgi:uncharacterized membrane protein (UPF0136 family)